MNALSPSGPQWAHNVRLNGMDLLQSQPSGSKPVDLAQPLLTAGDIARRLRVPRSSVYDYARRKHDPLPSVGIGRHRRFILRDVEVWLAERRLQ